MSVTKFHKDGCCIFILCTSSIIIVLIMNASSLQRGEIVLSKKVNIEGKSAQVEMETDKSKNRTIWKTLPPGTQMGELQVAAITKSLDQHGNLLVWGLGNDSPFWHDSTQGKVIFIEPKGFWLNKIKKAYPYLEAYSVNYTTNLKSSFNRYINNTELWSDLDLRSELPPIVIQTPWNVIIVDAPPGFNGGPGRYQSIYTSSLIAQNGTHIFVDDFDRKVEREFSLKMLGEPIEIIERKEKTYAFANTQAHFICCRSKMK